MSFHIVIDGYNFIRLSGPLLEFEQMDLETGRNALIDLLARYKRIRGYPVTVVFDGQGGLYGLPKKMMQKGIEVRFSHAGETADDVIRRIAAGKREKALVVSSDHEVQNASESQGAAVIGANDFYSKLMEVIFTGPGEEKTDSAPKKNTKTGTKKKGPGKRLPRRKRKHQKKIQKI